MSQAKKKQRPAATPAAPAAPAAPATPAAEVIVHSMGAAWCELFVQMNEEERSLEDLGIEPVVPMKKQMRSR